MTRLRSLAAVAVGLASVLALAGCDRAPSSTNAREWTPADHDRTEDQQRAAQGQAMPTSAAQARGSNADGGAAAVDPMATVVDITWRNQCATCHGLEGRGDGPNGPLLHATNLSDPAFQQARSDTDLANAIMNGKGRMPKFDLPPAAVVGLVARIRTIAAK